MNGLRWRTISTDKEVEGDEHNEGELADGRGLVWMGMALGRNNGRYKEHKEQHGAFRLRILLRTTKLPTNLQ
jgi:hypothetical protein